MDLILTDINGNEEGPISCNLDMDLAETMDFEIAFGASEDLSKLKEGCRIFVPNTEYGGIIALTRTQTHEEKVTFGGYTWFGLLSKKIIRPASGQDYRRVSGDVQQVLGTLIDEAGLSDLFYVSDELTGVSVSNYQFTRYCTLLGGIKRMLASAGYRLNVVYVEEERGTPGHVELSAVPIADHSSEIELSQDSEVSFEFTRDRKGCTHLCCLGSGTLRSRMVLDLYIQQDGSIGTTPYYTGLDDVTEVYDYSSVESYEDLEKEGRERLLELASSTDFEMNIESLDIDIPLWDIVGGRDYITGMSMKQPIQNKILRIEDGKTSIEYQLKGPEEEEEID